MTRLAALAVVEQHPEDFQEIAKILMHHISIEMQTIKSASPASGSTEFISPSMLAALEGLDDFFSPSEVWGDDVLLYAFFGVMSSSAISWSSFLEWFCITVDRCLEAGRNIAQAITVTRILDKMFCLLLARASLIHSKITHRSILDTFLRLWLVDGDRDQVTLSLPQLMSLNIFSHKQFMDVFAGSYQDLARISLDHLGMAYEHSKTALEFQGIGVSGMISLIQVLFTRIENGIRYLILHGMLALYVSIIRDIVSHLRDDPPRQPAELSIFFCSGMVGHLSEALTYGPVYIVEAIDAGIVPALLSTCLFWSRPILDEIDDAMVLGTAGEYIEKCLSILLFHVFLKRVIRHVCSRGDCLPPGVSFRDVALAPFNETASLFLGRVEMSKKIKQYFYLQYSRSNHCDNPRCPAAISGIHLGKLKECSRCLTLRVYSKKCLQEEWPDHRNVCKQIAKTLKEHILIPPTMIQPSELHYCMYVLRWLAINLKAASSSTYRNNNSKLRPSSSSDQPTHALKIDMDSDPMMFGIRSIVNSHMTSQTFPYGECLTCHT